MPDEDVDHNNLCIMRFTSTKQFPGKKSYRFEHTKTANMDNDNLLKVMVLFLFERVSVNTAQYNHNFVFGHFYILSFTLGCIPYMMCEYCPLEDS